MTEYYTENLADIGYREIKMLREIFDLWIDQGLPDNFTNNGVKPAMNKSNGYVFLINEDYQCCMIQSLNNGGNVLSVWNNTPYHCHEGFIDDLMYQYQPEDLNSDNVKYILSYVDDAREEIPAQWQNLTDQDSDS